MTTQCKSAVVLIAILMFTFGCEEIWYGTLQIDKAEVCGRYDANFGETNINYIDILEDSTFVSYYRTINDHLFVDTGIWRFVDWSYNNSRRYSLQLYGYIHHHPEKCAELNAMDSIQDTSHWSRYYLLKRKGLEKNIRIYFEYCPEKYWIYSKINRTAGSIS